MYILNALTTWHVLTTCTFFVYKNPQIIKFILQIIDFHKYGHIMYSHCNFSYWIMVIIGLAEKEVWRFELSFICCTFKAKFLPLKLWCHTHFNFCACILVNDIINVRLIMCPCSRKVQAALLAAFFVLFLSPVMLNSSRNSNRNNASTRYKAIIQFWRLSTRIANQDKSNINKNTCKTSFLLTKQFVRSSTSL